MESKKLSTLQIVISIIGVYWIFQFGRHLFFEPPFPLTPELLFQQVFTSKSLMVLALVVLMRFGTTSFSELGVSSNKIISQLLCGTGFGILAFLLINIGLNSVLQSLHPEPNNDNMVNIVSYLKEPKHLLIWIGIAIFGGGIVEEWQRIFILTRFEKWMGKYGLLLALFIDLLIFGMGHLYQGINGAISAGVAGLLYALVYLRKRSAIEAITCHAVYDIIGVLIGHFLMN